MTKRITISTLDAMKSSGDKFVMITAYDATFARLASEAGAETILVGDSLGMVLQGHETTIPVSLDAMVYHTECVARAKPRSLIVADLPFMSFSNSDDALHASTQLMQAGAQMVKLEGGTWLSDSINRLVERGVPVCAHLGLTPQSVNVFGGYRVQGRTPKRPSRSLPMRSKFRTPEPACWSWSVFLQNSPETLRQNWISRLLESVRAEALMRKCSFYTTCSA